MKIYVERIEDLPVIVNHGGAGSWRESDPKIDEILRSSAFQGLNRSREDLVEAVVEAVEVLEDTCLLNAGKGSSLDYYGGISMDAGVMDGAHMDYGAVSNVSYPLHPIRLAFIVLRETAHTFLTGWGADILAAIKGLAPHPDPCRDRIEKWIKAREHGMPSYLKANEKFLKGDTVGAVIVTDDNAVAAVSTGGLMLKMPGRVGDSPLVGGGFYSTGKTGVVATGIGEYISRFLLSYRIAIAYEDSGVNGVKKVFANFTDLFGAGSAGFILASADGVVIAAYNTEYMPWKVCSEKRCI